RGGNTNSTWENIIAALRGINMIVGVNAVSQQLGCQMRQYLVDIHITAGARAGLVGVYRKLLGEVFSADLIASLNNSLGSLVGKLPEFGIGTGGSAFDGDYRFDQGGR